MKFSPHGSPIPLVYVE